MTRKTVYSRESGLLASLLREARLKSGLHQAQVAEKMGVDQTVISNVERGQRRIDLVEFYNFAIAIEVNPTQLFEIAITLWNDDSAVSSTRQSGRKKISGTADKTKVNPGGDRERIDKKLGAFFAQTDEMGLDPMQLSRIGQMAYFALNPIVKQAASVPVGQEWSVEIDVGGGDGGHFEGWQDDAFHLVEQFLAQRFVTVRVERVSTALRRYFLKAVRPV